MYPEIVEKKKTILVVMPHMKMGGSPISLLRFLNKLDFNRVEVTLLLMDNTGELLEEIPNEINIKKMEFRNSLSKKLVTSGIKDITFIQRVYLKFFRELIKVLNPKSMNPIYDYCLSYVKKIENSYDMVLDYHGYGYFTSAFCAKKIISKKKIMWIHAADIGFIEKVYPYIADYTDFFGVSQTSVNVFKHKYPCLKDKIKVFYNIINVNEIIYRANHSTEKKDFEGDFKILTIGRLVEDKGIDLAIEAAKIVKEKGFIFKWYVIGEGKLKGKLKKMILDNNLTENFILLGFKSNPYPYIKKSDLYVQTSRNEGYGLAISEARVLKKPIISTNIEAVQEQIEDGFNGILVDLNPKKLAEEIIKLIKYPEMRERFTMRLEEEINDNSEELNKIYDLLN